MRREDCTFACVCVCVRALLTLLWLYGTTSLLGALRQVGHIGCIYTVGQVTNSEICLARLCEAQITYVSRQKHVK